MHSWLLVYICVVFGIPVNIDCASSVQAVLHKCYCLWFANVLIVKKINLASIFVFCLEAGLILTWMYLYHSFNLCVFVGWGGKLPPPPISHAVVKGL